MCVRSIRKSGEDAFRSPAAGRSFRRNIPYTPQRELLVLEDKREPEEPGRNHTAAEKYRRKYEKGRKNG